MAANNPACRHQPCPCCSSAPAGTGRPLAALVRTSGGLIDSPPASRHMEPNGCRIPHPEAEGASGDCPVPFGSEAPDWPLTWSALDRAAKRRAVARAGLPAGVRQFGVMARHAHPPDAWRQPPSRAVRHGSVGGKHGAASAWRAGDHDGQAAGARRVPWSTLDSSRLP